MFEKEADENLKERLIDEAQAGWNKLELHKRFWGSEFSYYDGYIDCGIEKEKRIKELEQKNNRLKEWVKGTVMMYEPFIKAKELLRDIYNIDCEGWNIRCRIAELLKEIE